MIEIDTGRMRCQHKGSTIIVFRKKVTASAVAASWPAQVLESTLMVQACKRKGRTSVICFLQVLWQRNALRTHLSSKFSDWRRACRLAFTLLAARLHLLQAHTGRQHAAEAEPVSRSIQHFHGKRSSRVRVTVDLSLRRRGDARPGRPLDCARRFRLRCRYQYGSW